MSRFSRGSGAVLMDFGGGELIRLIEVAAASSSVYFFLPSLRHDPPEFNCDVVKWDYGSSVGVVEVERVGWGGGSHMASAAFYICWGL